MKATLSLLVLFFFFFFSVTAQSDLKHINTKAPKLVPSTPLSDTLKFKNQPYKKNKVNECGGFVKLSVDKFTGNETISQQKKCVLTNVSGQKIDLEFSYLQHTLALTWINLNEGSICADENDIMYFIFDDDSKSQAFYQADFNCNTQFHFFLGAGILNDTYKFITTKKISSIRFSTRKLIMDFDLTKVQSQYLHDVVACLIQND